MSRQIVVPFFLIRCFPRVSGDEPGGWDWLKDAADVFPA